MPCLTLDACLLVKGEHWGLHVGNCEAMKGDAAKSLAEPGLEMVAKNGGNWIQGMATDRNSLRARRAAGYAGADDAVEMEEALDVRWGVVVG